MGRKKHRLGNVLTMRGLYEAIAERQPERSFHLGVDLAHCYHSEDGNASTMVTFKFYHHATQTHLSDETIGGLADKVISFLDSPESRPAPTPPAEGKAETFLEATKELPHAAD